MVGDAPDGAGMEEAVMNVEELFGRYRDLQTYVGWTEEDARRVEAVASIMEPCFGSLIDDFYDEIERHPAARNVITGGQQQIERLKGTLRAWLRELFAGRYDREYVARRWRVGWKHVEIGLNQTYTNVALSRLRSGMVRQLQDRWRDGPEKLIATVRSLNMLIDLDLAVIEDAYQTEYSARQQRSERLAAIGQVAAGVAHELRNPLNVVKTSVYFLLNARDPSPRKIAEHLQRIERHVTLADGVITALSNFARLPVPNLRPVPVEPLVREALESNPLPENIQVMVDCPADIPAVLVDPDQVRIVLSNLIRNARDAMPEGGRLSILGRRVGAGVDIDVADTGAGIAADNLAHIMEPLFSTKARGLGLGLAIARSILEKNRGSLSVTSELGKGSTFTVHVTAFLE